MKAVPAVAVAAMTAVATAVASAAATASAVTVTVAVAAAVTVTEAMTATVKAAATARTVDMARTKLWDLPESPAYPGTAAVRWRWRAFLLRRQHPHKRLPRVFPSNVAEVLCTPRHQRNFATICRVVVTTIQVETFLRLWLRR